MNKILLVSLLLISFILIVILFYTNDKFTPGRKLLSLTGSGTQSPVPQELRYAIENAYSDGFGVLISGSKSFKYSQSERATIAGSGSIVRDMFNNQLYGPKTDNSCYVGYVWHPDDNLKTLDCTYTGDADTMQRAINTDPHDRCSFIESTSLPSPKYPIMCNNPEINTCNFGYNCYSDDGSPPEPCPQYPNEKCPTSLCRPGESCVNCMFRQSVKLQPPNSNFPTTRPSHCPMCTYNEVVFNRNATREKLLSEAQEEVFKDKPGPSGIVIGIPRNWGEGTSTGRYIRNETLCSELLDSYNPNLFEFLKANFVPDTVIILMRCNTSVSQDSKIDSDDIRPLDFVDAFQLKDIETKICKK